MVIFPSILEKTAEDLFNQIKKLSPYFSHFQLDIADGIFVPNKTVQIEEIITFFQNHESRIMNQEFEFHLMVKDYEKEIKKLEKLRNKIRIKTILIHASLIPDYSLLPTRYPQFSFGLVLNPEDNISLLPTPYSLIPIIQIMSINPGFQGQPFLPETLQKVEQLRLAHYRNKISLDGAVNDKTIPIIMAQKYRPYILCTGSYLTKAENLAERIQYLTKVATI